MLMFNINICHGLARHTYNHHRDGNSFSGLLSLFIIGLDSFWSIEMPDWSTIHQFFKVHSGVECLTVSQSKH